MRRYLSDGGALNDIRHRSLLSPYRRTTKRCDVALLEPVPTSFAPSPTRVKGMLSRGFPSFQRLHASVLPVLRPTRALNCSTSFFPEHGHRWTHRPWSPYGRLLRRQATHLAIQDDLRRRAVKTLSDALTPFGRARLKQRLPSVANSWFCHVDADSRRASIERDL